MSHTSHRISKLLLIYCAAAAYLQPLIEVCTVNNCHFSRLVNTRASAAVSKTDISKFIHRSYRLI